MDKTKLYTLITNSTAREGSTLTLAQNTRLLDHGISSEGKTIAEQLLNLDMKAAYDAAIKDAEGHQVWSAYRIKLLAAKALKSYGFDCDRVSDEAALQAICHEANEARMHARTLKDEGLKQAAKAIQNKVQEANLWPKGNGLVAGLLMNMILIEFGIEPKVSAAPKAEATVLKDLPIKNSTRILDILSLHPRYTTAELAEILGISAKGVEKHIAKLKQTGALLRVGPDKGGHWLVKR